MERKGQPDRDRKTDDDEDDEGACDEHLLVVHEHVHKLIKRVQLRGAVGRADLLRGRERRERKREYDVEDDADEPRDPNEIPPIQLHFLCYQCRQQKNVALPDPDVWVTVRSSRITLVRTLSAMVEVHSQARVVLRLLHLFQLVVALAATRIFEEPAGVFQADGTAGRPVTVLRARAARGAGAVDHIRAASQLRWGHIPFGARDARAGVECAE